MANSYINLEDIGTTREVLLRTPPRGVRNLILITGGVLVALAIVLAFLPVQQTQTAQGIVQGADQTRQVTAQASGTVATVYAVDGDVVTAGETILALDVSNAQEQLATLKAQDTQNQADIAAYEQLRAAASGTDNPFDPATQPSFYYSLVQYRQNLAQAADQATQNSASQTSSRAQAQAALTQNQSALNSTANRIAQLNALVAAIRSGTGYSSSDSYAQSLYNSWQSGRPSASVAAATGQSPSDYDASFIAQVETQISSMQTQQTSYSTQVAQLQSQLNQPVIDPTADPKAAVTANFMLQASTSEQQIQTQQVNIQLQEMSLELQIEQANIKAPVAGTLNSQVDYQPGDQLSAGQQLFQVVPTTGGTVIQAAIPASMIAAVSVGQSISCTVPDDPAGNAVKISCQVTQMSTSYYQTQDGQLFYDVKFGLEPGAELHGYGANLPAGLQVNITIPVHESSALRWLGQKVGLIKN